MLAAATGARDRLTPSLHGANGACIQLTVLSFFHRCHILHCVSISRPRKCLVRALEWVAFETFRTLAFAHVSTVRALFAVFIAVCAAEVHCNFFFFVMR